MEEPGATCAAISNAVCHLERKTLNGNTFNGDTLYGNTLYRNTSSGRHLMGVLRYFKGSKPLFQLLANDAPSLLLTQCYGHCSHS